MSAHDHSRVSPEGKALGIRMAVLAEAEIAALARDGEADERCKSCAFRAGTVPNGCVQTQLDVQKAVAEDVPFMCHCGPNRVCFGWFAVRRIVDRYEAATGNKLPACDYEFSAKD